VRIRYALRFSLALTLAFLYQTFSWRRSTVALDYTNLMAVLMVVATLQSCVPTSAGNASATSTPRDPQLRLWRPALNTSWQWQLTGLVDLSVQADMFDIDLFDNEASTVEALHAKGSTVVCYLSAGSWEEWRPDAAQIPVSIRGRDLDDWPGEKWLDIRRLDLLMPIMEARLDLCRSKGFDGAEFDNVDGYTNETGFPLSYQDQLRYNMFLANAARARGLSPGLKNDLDQIPDLIQYFDWALSEQCFEYEECDALSAFVRAGKPVFVSEYHLDVKEFCPQALALNFNAIRKLLALDAWREVC
jgi:hypothetical protein